MKKTKCLVLNFKIFSGTALLIQQLKSEKKANDYSFLDLNLDTMTDADWDNALAQINNSKKCLVL